MRKLRHAEPPVRTALLLLLGDRMSLVQVLGGILVLLAVVVVQGAQLVEARGAGRLNAGNRAR